MSTAEGIIECIREAIEEDATPEEYQALLDSVDFMGAYDRRGKEIVKKWEWEANRRKAAEDKLPVIPPEVRGHIAYTDFKKSADFLKSLGAFK